MRLVMIEYDFFQPFAYFSPVPIFLAFQSTNTLLTWRFQLIQSVWSVEKQPQHLTMKQL